MVKEKMITDQQEIFYYLGLPKDAPCLQPPRKFMQFTGLHDKTGKEIYESDILRSRENYEVFRVDPIFPVYRHTHITNIGYFSGKKYHTRVHSAAYDNLDDWMSWPEMYEVIGNIYENPKLSEH